MAFDGRIMIVGTTSIDEVSIFRRSLGNKWFSFRNCILGYFFDTEVMLPLESNIVHETYRSFGCIGFNLLRILWWWSLFGFASSGGSDRLVVNGMCPFDVEEEEDVVVSECQCILGLCKIGPYLGIRRSIRCMEVFGKWCLVDKVERKLYQCRTANDGPQFLFLFLSAIVADKDMNSTRTNILSLVDNTTTTNTITTAAKLLHPFSCKFIYL